jgi:hypothetical protein
VRPIVRNKQLLELAARNVPGSGVPRAYLLNPDGTLRHKDEIMALKSTELQVSSQDETIMAK